MSTRVARVDAYIAARADFSRPVLEHLRATVHAACPDVQETIKWGMPFFEHGGRPLAHMAAFKQHCAFGFWRGRQVANRGKDDEAMGQFGRIARQSDLPPPRELTHQSVIKTTKSEPKEPVIVS